MDYQIIMRKVLLSVGLLIFLAAAAHAQSAAFVPTCAGINDTAKFTAIKAAVGTSTPATIKLSYGKICKFTSSLTLTSNLVLDASDGGMIDVTNSSVTLTIQGPAILPARKVFLNATAGLGTISFSGNTVQKDYQVAWWGADTAAAGAATSAALNAAFAAMPFGSTMHLSAINYQHDGVTVDHKAQITIVGNESLDGYIDTGWGTSLTYVGTNGGAAITLNNVYASTLRGFASFAAATNTVPGTTGAAKNIYLTMTPGGSPPISSQNVLQSLKLAANNTRSDYRGIDFSNGSGTNNEFHQIRDCKIYGGSQGFGLNTGIGLYLGHSNVKHIIISGQTTIAGCATAIYSSGGSFRAYSPTFDSNSAVLAGSVSDGSFIIGADGENNTQIIAGLQGFGTVTFGLLYSRFDNLAGGQVASGSTSTAPVIDSKISGLVVEGCNFGAGGTFTSDFIYDSNGAQTSLRWLENHVYNSNDSALAFSDADLSKGLQTFKFWTDGRRVGGYGAPIGVGGDWVSLDGYTSSNTRARLISIQGDSTSDGGPSKSGLQSCALDNICIGAGEVEITGVRPVHAPMLTVAGTAGSTIYQLAVVGLDSAGNKTFRSYGTSVSNANATLSGTNKIVLTFPHSVGAASYDIIQANNADASMWRLVANQAASGTGTQTYNVIANPAGAYTYALPTYNETATLKFRGAPTFNNASPVAFTPSSPAQITSNQNNYNPGGSTPFASTIIRLNSDASRNITGITFTKTQTDGELHYLLNVGTQDIVLKNQDTNSSAANRFLNTSGADIVLTSNQQALAIYDGTTARWRVSQLNLGVKTYVALLTQTAGNAPVATVLQNTLGGSVVWARSAQGVYTGTLVAAFTVARTGVLISPLPHLSATASQIAEFDHTSADVITVHTMSQDGGVGTGLLNDGRLTDTMIRIEVYPP